MGWCYFYTSWIWCFKCNWPQSDIVRDGLNIKLILCVTFCNSSIILNFNLWQMTKNYLDLLNITESWLQIHTPEYWIPYEKLNGEFEIFIFFFCFHYQIGLVRLHNLCWFMSIVEMFTVLCESVSAPTECSVALGDALIDGEIARNNNDWIWKL